MRPNANRQTSAGLRGLANLRRAIDIAMNVLHLRFDILAQSSNVCECSDSFASGKSVL